MVTATFALPALFGDHHVLEVRNLLAHLPGITKLYASSCFQMVEVQFDDSQLTVEAIKTQLEKAGYLDELPVPAERKGDHAATHGNTFFRHAAASETTPTISFVQELPLTGRPLWPCPGLSTHKIEEEVTHG